MFPREEELFWGIVFQFALEFLFLFSTTLANLKTTIPLLILTQYRNANVASADPIDHFRIPILRACAWQRV